MSNKLRTPLVVLLFFLSGLASLVLETVWVRMMVLVFGSTTFAVSTVLTAFMLGLALGCWLAGRWADRMSSGRAIAVYGLLELGIGGYALLMPTLVAWLPDVHAALFGTTHTSYYTFALLRFLLAGACLAVPATAMGATLPVLARYFCAGGSSEATGKTVGSLYAVNTGGAVAGVFLAGFLLLPSIGTRHTNLTACLVDLVLGLTALALSRGGAGRPEEAGGDAPADADAAPSGWLPTIALISIGVSGAVAMVYQVGWTRSLTLIIGSSTYAFSLILVCFLLGLSAGAAVYARRKTADLSAQPANLAVIHLLIAFCCFGGMLIMDRLPLVLLALMQQVELAPLTMFGLKFGVAAVVILLPTFFMGMIFPAVIRIYSTRGLAPARTTGDVYSTNTLGAIIGSFAGGFVLVPLMGLQRTLLAMVVMGLILGGLFGALASRRKDRLLLPATAVVLMVALLIVGRPWDLEVLTSGVFRVSRYAHLLDTVAATREKKSGQKVRSARERWMDLARSKIPASSALDTFLEPTDGYRVVSHKEGVTTTVSMTRTVDQSLSSQACWVRTSLLVNGKPDASLSVAHRRPAEGCEGLLERIPPGSAMYISPSGDAETQILSGMLPVALHPDAGAMKRALVIGWGSGITVGALLQSGIQRIVAVELEGEVVEAARLFEPHNHQPQLNSRVQVVNADGRNHLATDPGTYDVIVSEPSNPWMAGCGNLFTREFFRLVRSRLNKGGLYLQWLQAYEIAPDNVWSILATMAETFPSVHVFSPAQAPSDMLLVARLDRARPRWDRVVARMKEPGIKKELARVSIHGPADLAARLLAGPDGVRKVTARARINTDDNALIEFNAPKDLINYSRYSARSIISRLRQTTPDPLALFGGVSSEDEPAFCWAALSAGRWRWIAGRTWRSRSPDLRRCREAGQEQGRAPEPPTEADVRALMGADARVGAVLALRGKKPAEALAGLYRLFRPSGSRTEQYLGLCLLGHHHALAGDKFHALAMLTAARNLGPPWDAYPPLDRVLSRVLTRSGLHRVAAARASQ